MKGKEPMQEQSKVRSLLIQAEIALKEDRFEEALALICGIKTEDFVSLQPDELYAIGNLVTYIKGLAEEKKSSLLSKMKVVQASKKYI